MLEKSALLDDAALLQRVVRVRFLSPLNFIAWHNFSPVRKFAIGISQRKFKANIFFSFHRDGIFILSRLSFVRDNKNGNARLNQLASSV